MRFREEVDVSGGFLGPTDSYIYFKFKVTNSMAYIARKSMFRNITLYRDHSSPSMQKTERLFVPFEAL